MKTTAQVCVIGGGVVGASVLYHLTKYGWSDVLLVERSELTSGSTWHAAGGFHTLNGDTNMAALQGYTIGLYKELEAITGMSCGLHHVGGLTLADTPERFDMLKAERAKHRYMGLETEILGPAEIRERAELVNTDGILGALYDPLDGHLDPSGTTHAYARAARMGGATVELHCKVTGLTQRPDGSWTVHTEKGDIHAEHVVNAAGLWAREVGAMAGVYHPLLPMAHQYLVTDDIPEIHERGSEFPHVIDPGGESYLRQEGRGLCIGFYEQKCEPWAVDGTPWEFGHELLNDRFDKIEDSVAFAYARFPVLERAGVKRVIHGPFTFAPDGNPLVGPVPGLRNYWAACAVMAGFSQAGGVGLTLAQWMVDGQPEQNSFALDVARFGIGRRRAIPCRRSSRTIRSASRSAIRTRNCPPRGRSAPRRCMTSSPGWARSGARNTASKWRTTLPCPASRPTRRRRFAVRMRGRRRGPRCRRCAAGSASTRSTISPSTG
jgi:dimethylglycine dehydrogenase